MGQWSLQGEGTGPDVGEGGPVETVTVVQGQWWRLCEGRGPIKGLLLWTPALTLPLGREPSVPCSLTQNLQLYLQAARIKG